MEEILRKTYRAEVKEVNAEEGTVDLMIPISSNQVDRDGEIIDPIAFKKTIPKFMKHPVLVASHDYKALTNQIGEWTKLKVEDNGVSGKPKYYINAGNEQADWAYYLASKGVAAFSVGFIPKVWDDGDGEKTPRRTYKEVELLEISQVIIPSNREAIQSMRSKSVNDPVITALCNEAEKTIEEKEIITKPEVTDDYIHIPIKDAGQFQPDSFRTIDISKGQGIKAVIGKLKGETKTTVQKYMFEKSKDWTLEKAKAWVKEHEGKEFSEEDGIIIKEEKQKKPISQSQIVDEIDYLKSLIDKVGAAEATLKSLNDSIGGYLKQMNMDKMQEMHDMMESCATMAEKSMKIAEDMMSEMDNQEGRTPGNDIPVETKNNIDSFDDILKEIQTTKLGGK